MQPLNIEIDEEEYEALQKLQRQYGLDSIEDVATMLFKRKMNDVTHQLTGNLEEQTWL